MDSDFQVAEAPTPFEPQAADLGGCGRPAVFGCLMALVLVAAGAIVFMLKVRDMLDWALTKYEDAIVVNLSDQVTAAERERLVRAFAAARAAIRDNRIDPDAMQRLQRFMVAPPSAGGPLGPATVRELTEVLEGIGKPAIGPPDQELGPAPVKSGTTVARSVPSPHAAV